MKLFDSFSNSPVKPLNDRPVLPIASFVTQDNVNLTLTPPLLGRLDISPQPACVDGTVQNTGYGKKVCKCNLAGCTWYEVPKKGNNTDPAKDGPCPGPAYILGPLVTFAVFYSLKKRFLS